MSQSHRLEQLAILCHSPTDSFAERAQGWRCREDHQGCQIKARVSCQYFYIMFCFRLEKTLEFTNHTNVLMIGEWFKVYQKFNQKIEQEFQSITDLILGFNIK